MLNGWVKIALLALLVLIIIILIIWLCWCGGDSKKCRPKKKCVKPIRDLFKKKTKKCPPPKPCSPKKAESSCGEESCSDDDSECDEDHLTCCQKIERLEKKLCQFQSRTTYDIQQILKQITDVRGEQHTFLGEWSLNFTDDQTSVQPGTRSNVPMLLSVATTQGADILITAQKGATNVHQMPFAGKLEALTVQVPDTLSAGTMAFTVTLNGLPVALSASMTTVTPSGLLTLYPVTPISFVAEDQIGITFSSSGATLQSLPASFTAQLWGTFT